MNRGVLLTVKDADFLRRIDEVESSAGLYLKGQDRARARRLAKLGMVVGGRLDPARYALLTRKGAAFVERMRGAR